MRGAGGGAPPCRGGALSSAPPWRRWGRSGPRTEWRPARGHRVHQAAGAARRLGTRERGHRVHRGGAGLVRPSHRMAAGGRGGQAAGEWGTEVTEYTGGGAGLREWFSDGGSEALAKAQSRQSEK